MQSLTLTYVDENFEMQTFMLKCTEFSDQHTKETIAKKIDECISEIPALAYVDHIVCTSDGAANMIAGMRESKTVTDQ